MVKQDILAQELSSKEALLTKVSEILPYLQDIIDGKICSTRHATFYSDMRWQLGRVLVDPEKMCFTAPLNDEQITIVYKMLGLMVTKTTDKNDYIFKVLLPELLVKMYMMKFFVEKYEAEKMLSETPVRDDQPAPVKQQQLKFTFEGGLSGMEDPRSYPDALKGRVALLMKITLHMGQFPQDRNLPF